MTAVHVEGGGGAGVCHGRVAVGRRHYHPRHASTDPMGRARRRHGSSLAGAGIRVEELPVRDQYRVQADLFARAIREGGPAPTSMEEAVRNMAVIDAVFRSARSGAWEAPSAL